MIAGPMMWRTAWPGEANTDIAKFYRRLGARFARPCRSGRHVQPAVVVDGLPRDVAVAEHGYGKRGEFLRFAEPADRDAVRPRAQVRGHHVALDERRSERIGGDVLLGKMRGEPVRESVEAGLGRRIMRADDAADLRRNRRHVQDPAPPGFAHA